MNKNIVWYWNLVHYHLFLFLKKAHFLFSYINPFRLFYKIPGIKKFYAKHGIKDMNKFVDEVGFNNPVTGINSIWAGMYMGGLLILLEYSIFNFIQAFLGKSLIQYIYRDQENKILFLLLLLTFAGLINYFTLFKNDRYLTYFKEFEQMPKQEKKKYPWVSFVVVLLILLIFIGGFAFLGYKLPA
jgi:hypothetical protein